MLDFSNITDSPGSTAGWVVGALIALGLSMQKLVKNWNETSAENKVIVTLRDELTRLSDQNAKLDTMLNKQQTQLIDMQKQISLREERIDHLEREVRNLKRLIPADHPELVSSYGNL